MAKSTYRVEFPENRGEYDMVYFKHDLYRHIASYDMWLSKCNFFSRKDKLYVYTADYSCVDIIVERLSGRYGCKCIDLRKSLKDVKNKAKVCK